MEVEEIGGPELTRRKRTQMGKESERPSSIDQGEVALVSSNVIYRSDNWLFPALLLFRIINALVIKTFFVPDEFWQGPEVAHRVVFGYGYLTWEWKEGLRGWTFPLIFATSYKLLALFGIDTAKFLVVLPRVMQACFASFGDLFLYKLAAKRFDLQTARWTLICYLISWFTLYCVTRTLTNSLETVLTTMALYYWPCGGQKDGIKQTFKSLSVAAISCIIRPTAAVMWIPLCAFYLFSLPDKLSFIVSCISPIGCLAILWSLIVNSWCCGKWTLVELNFVKFNVITDMGTFYGSHPWHWYFTQGFPAVMFTHLIPFFGGVYKASQKQQTLALLILWSIIVYSFLGHKEFRFIFPVVPLAMCYCGFFLSFLSGYQCEKKDHAFEDGFSRKVKSGWKAKMMVLFLVLTSIPLAIYTSTVHQKGTIDVMEYIQSESSKLRNTNDMSVLFLMPCHSTPFYSFVHRNISMRFLECPPSAEPGYIDEADQFYRHPTSWLSEQFRDHRIPSGHQGEPHHLPSHLVLFNVLLQSISKWLEHFHYKEVTSFDNQTICNLKFLILASYLFASYVVFHRYPFLFHIT
ncbi:GPI mannosyltransferase 3 [Stylophora pistillata]|uniref:Mannosyltransferase n=2 Tax=Stylophora pistillata TaxID=50429 RepID=A0A2B4S1T9_STYPI|nr:GPI mannosyltransferase 3 [Stylophora pistillata]